MTDLSTITQEEMSEKALEFIASPMGAFIIERIEHDIEELRDQLEAIDPTWIKGYRHWRKVRMELEAVRRMNSYFVELVTMGAGYELEDTPD